MNIGGQEARIRREEEGYTVIYSGSTYPPGKVKVEGVNITPLLPMLRREEYVDVVITGKRDTVTEELTITDIKLKE